MEPCTSCYTFAADTVLDDEPICAACYLCETGEYLLDNCPICGEPTQPKGYDTEGYPMGWCVFCKQASGVLHCTFLEKDNAHD